MKTVSSFKIGRELLTVNSEGVQWENRILDGSISKPVEIRYGTRPIELDMFTIGSNYRLELRDSEKNKLTVSMKSYFGINGTRKFDLIQKIADSIWDEFFANRFCDLIKEWEDGLTIHIDKYKIDSESISRDNTFIKFSEMDIVNRSDHFIIDSKLNSRLYMNISYLKVWNWPLIQSILNRVIEKQQVANNT